MAVTPEITSDSSRMFTENVNIALRIGASSRMISRKSPPIGAGPTTRITSPGWQNSSVSKASMVARHHRRLRYGAVLPAGRRDPRGRTGDDGRRLSRDHSRRSADAQGDVDVLGEHPAAVAGDLRRHRHAGVLRAALPAG